MTRSARPPRHLLLAIVLAVALVTTSCSRSRPEPPPPAFDLSVFVAPSGAVQVRERTFDEEDYRDIHGNRVRRATTLLRAYRLPRTWTEAEFSAWVAATFPRPGWTSLKNPKKVGAYNRFEDDTAFRLLSIETSRSLAETRAETLREFSITQEVYPVSPANGS